MEGFLRQLIEGLEKRLSYTEEDYTVHQYTICKTNDTVLHSVVIRLGDEQISKNIYVEPYFYMNMRGTEMNEIVEKILAESANKDDALGLLERFNECRGYEDVKDKIIIRLACKSMNEEYLKDKVYVDIEDTDLVAIFYILVKKDEGSLLTTNIDYNTLKSWGHSSANDIYQLALDNTMRLLPATINDMVSVIGLDNFDDMGANVVDEAKRTMYVLTNEMFVNGSSSMLYDNVLKDFASNHNTDKVVIIPSSRHEVILLPHYKELDCSSCYSMLRDVNQYVVSDIDILSNSVYIYELDTDSISIWTEG